MSTKPYRRAGGTQDSRPRQPRTGCAERRRRQGPPAAPRSGSARAL